MINLCERNSRALRRLRQLHSEETGLVVQGWFKRLIYWPPARGWEVVTVKVDGQRRATLDETRRRPEWIALKPGVHLVQFLGLDGELRAEEIEFGKHPVLVAFKPPTWMPFKGPGRGQWCIRPLA